MADKITVYLNITVNPLKKIKVDHVPMNVNAISVLFALSLMCKSMICLCSLDNVAIGRPILHNGTETKYH